MSKGNRATPISRGEHARPIADPITLGILSPLDWSKDLGNATQKGTHVIETVVRARRKSGPEAVFASPFQ
ncbi:MAG: hypothetical protein AM324_010380 [Candidatus Thorarchaeota archaeon SMTZ1-83]|nr:MAG: hypothetical protein AM324_11750 [Candidatus Thorarchaeota archaeon SMTZ1-83]